MFSQGLHGFRITYTLAEFFIETKIPEECRFNEFLLNL